MYKFLALFLFSTIAFAAPPVVTVSGCGAGAVVLQVTDGNVGPFRIDTGTVTAGGVGLQDLTCTLTFNNAWPTPPNCVVSSASPYDLPTVTSSETEFSFSYKQYPGTETAWVCIAKH